jgi:transcription-repair coupling factor (superfamily II helicase)
VADEPLERVPGHDDDVITDAILREIDRAGQVFFVHNRVETIHNTALQVQKLVPYVKVAVGHGQMAERQLEQVMLDFLDNMAAVGA